ncbi:hypothetical protein Aduo_016331 [Ancylostoma duodenale]
MFLDATVFNIEGSVFKSAPPAEAVKSIYWVDNTKNKSVYLLPPLISLESANNKDTNVRGHFSCNFHIDGHEARGNCHVADTPSLLDFNWIAQNEPYSNASQEEPSATLYPPPRSTLYEHH